MKKSMFFTFTINLIIHLQLVLQTIVLFLIYQHAFLNSPVRSSDDPVSSFVFSLDAVLVGIAVLVLAELILGMELAASGVRGSSVGVGRSSGVGRGSSVGVGGSGGGVGVGGCGSSGVGVSRSSVICQRQTGVRAIGQGVLHLRLLSGGQSQQAGNCDLK